MPVSLPHAANPVGLLVSARRSGAMDWINDWLKRAEQRRAERLIAQYICDSGIQDFGDDADIAVRRRPLD